MMNPIPDSRRHGNFRRQISASERVGDLSLSQKPSSGHGCLRVRTPPTDLLDAMTVLSGGVPRASGPRLSEDNALAPAR
jgi:hypothetical protein